jgi:peptidyl-prolyl cis-trans isomerase D
MLDAMRRGAQGWLAKVLFAILIISFGVFWNVSDVFRGYGQGSIAKVGEAEVTSTEFQRAFQDQVRSITTQAGKRLSNEQALALGLDRQALDRLIAQKAVRAHAGDLNLALSDEELVRGLKQDPNFFGADGKFSKIGFDGLIRQMGLSEAGFFALRREDELRRQITDALRGSIIVPKALIDEKNAYDGETRTIEHVKIDPVKGVTVPEPDEAKLKETYEANKTQFMTSEYRKTQVVVLSVDDLKKEITLSDDDVKASYEETKDTYDKPERRRIQQIAFKDKAAAEEARKALEDGSKNFLDVAKEVGATEADVNLGILTKDQLIDSAIADTAFSLARDELSKVIEGSFAVVLVRVIEIEEGKKSTFDEVKDQVRDKLATSKARSLIQDRIDLVEEGRNAGKTLKEIGEAQKLRFFDIEATDAANKTPDEKTAFDYPDAAIVLKEIFVASVGAEYEAVELPGDSFAWYNLASVTPKKQKPFADVQDAVRAFYMDREKSRLLDELAAKLAEQLKNGGDIDKVAADAGGKAELTESIRREMSPPGLTVPAVKRAFSLAKGDTGYAATSDGSTRTVYRVKEITPAESASKEQAKNLETEIRNSLENELLISYVGALRSRFGVTINQTELNRATGASAGQQ